MLIFGIFLSNVTLMLSVQMMLLQHGGQPALLLHHGPGSVRRLLLLLLHDRGAPVRSGLRSCPTMFQVRILAASGSESLKEKKYGNPTVANSSVFDCF